MMMMIETKAEKKKTRRQTTENERPMVIFLLRQPCRSAQVKDNHDDRLIFTE
jgi:hypothetical protein